MQAEDSWKRLVAFEFAEGREITCVCGGGEMSTRTAVSLQ